MSHNCRCGNGENCCENAQNGFNCTCEHEKNNPGNIEYSCEFCGIYTASRPMCNKCEAEEPDEIHPD